MPSPFPGMDPFLKNREWRAFHTDFHTFLRGALSRQLEPDYMVSVERRVH